MNDIIFVKYCHCPKPWSEAPYMGFIQVPHQPYSKGRDFMFTPYYSNHLRWIYKVCSTADVAVSRAANTEVDMMLGWVIQLVDSSHLMVT